MFKKHSSSAKTGVLPNRDANVSAHTVTEILQVCDQVRENNKLT